MLTTLDSRATKFGAVTILGERHILNLRVDHLPTQGAEPHMWATFCGPQLRPVVTIRLSIYCNTD